MLAKYNVTESEGETGKKAQTREKLLRFLGQRGNMANRENIQGELDKRKS